VYTKGVLSHLALVFTFKVAHGECITKFAKTWPNSSLALLCLLFPPTPCQTLPSPHYPSETRIRCFFVGGRVQARRQRAPRLAPRGAAAPRRRPFKHFFRIEQKCMSQSPDRVSRQKKNLRRQPPSAGSQGRPQWYC